MTRMGLFPLFATAAVCLTARAATLTAAPSAPLFPDAERARLVAFWNEPGRYRVTAPPEAAKNGPWQVHLTVDGSKWFLTYQKAIGAAKAPPTVDASAAADPEKGAWETWVQAKLAYDRGAAQAVVDRANASLRSTESAGQPSLPITQSS